MTTSEKRAVWPEDRVIDETVDFHVKIAMLTADIEDLKTERDLYKKLWQEQIGLRTGHEFGKKGTKPAFWHWLSGNKAGTRREQR